MRKLDKLERPILVLELLIVLTLGAWTVFQIHHHRVQHAGDAADCRARVEFFVAGGALDPNDDATAFNACVKCEEESKESSCRYWLDRLK